MGLFCAVDDMGFFAYGNSTWAWCGVGVGHTQFVIKYAGDAFSSIVLQEHFKRGKYT